MIPVNLVPRVLKSILLVLAAGNLQAQQIADLDYNPPIPRPTYGIGTGPKVAIDEGHNNFHTVSGRYLPFANLLRRDGYRVEGFTSTITREKLDAISVLVIANPLAAQNVGNWTLPTPSAYTAAEINILRSWVQDGGSLFLIADHMPFPGAAGNLALAFGAQFSNGYAVSGNSGGWVDIFTSTTGLAPANIITQGRPGDDPVTSVGTFGGSAFQLPEGATPILLFGEGAISHETPTAPGIAPGSPQVDINGWSQGAILNSGHGRVALFGEAAMFSAQLAGANQRTMGMNDAGAAQNYRLALNLLRWLSSADILVELSPKDALYDSDVKGFVTDDGYGPANANNKSGVPAIDDNTANARRHELGFTFNIAFTPTADDLTGNRLLIELGAHLNGTGLFLVDGVPTLFGKQNSAAADVPSSLNDTTLPAIAVQSSIGALTVGTPYVFSASWDHQGNLELKVSANQGVPVVNTFAITGTYGNWSGNDTLNVRTPHRANIGGLSGAGAEQHFGHPYDVDSATAFQGDISRALFWNAYSFTPQGQPPVIDAFEITSLGDQPLLRAHWSASAGEIGADVTLRIKSGDTVLHETSQLRGHFDLPSSSATDLSIEAVTSSGTAIRPAPALPAADSTFATAVRETGPVAWFRFNETTDSPLIVDSAENAAPHNGTLLGETVSKGNRGYIDGTGTFNGSADGNSGSAIITDRIIDLNTATQGFTIETVIRHRPVSGNVRRTIISQQDLVETGRLIFGVDDTGVPHTYLGGDSTSGAVRKNADELLPPNRWNHLVLVADAQARAVRWYIDGEYAGTTADGRNPDNSTFNPSLPFEASQGAWIIGAAKSLNFLFLRGDIDDLAVYDKLLDDLNGDGDRSDSRIAVHRDAWWNEVAQVSVSPAPLPSGQSATLGLSLPAGVDAVSIDGVPGPIPIAEGAASAEVTPAETTTYRIVTTGTLGTASRGVTVSVVPSNLPPEFSGYALTTARNTAVTLSIAKVLARASDPDGGTPAISSVSATSSQNGSVVLNPTSISYTPPVDFDGLDLIPIVLSDGQGGTTAASITVTVTAGGTGGSGPSANQAHLTIQPDGSVALLFAGIPGRSYEVQRSTDLANWNWIADVTAAADGSIPWVDLNPPAGGSAYYRTAAPSN